MAQDLHHLVYAFNRGRVSQLALGRVDIQRLAVSAQKMTNWMPRALGSMMLRPGLRFVGLSPGGPRAVFIPFVFALGDTALIELNGLHFHLWIDDALVFRPPVSSVVVNSDFATDLSGWTSADEVGTVSEWATGGYLRMRGTGFRYAGRRQQVNIAAGDRSQEHALYLTIIRGFVRLKVGTAAGLDDVLAAVELSAGVHSLAFVPNVASVWIEVSSKETYFSYLDGIAFQTGLLELPSFWEDADLDHVRWDQSADVVFVACGSCQQQKIERRGKRSWSIVDYAPKDGPFRVLNITQITLAPSALDGDITLTASAPLFKVGHVGALFRITSIGQKVVADLSGDGQFTDPIRVTGVGGSRRFTVTFSGTWTGQAHLQQSVGDTNSWTNNKTYGSATTSVNENDNNDNAIIYYRVGFDAGDYGSGLAHVEITYASGGLTGIARVDGFTDSTHVSAHVLKDFGGTQPSTVWDEGLWSTFRGWPSAVALFEGRLWWAGHDRIVGSISDAYESFDDTKTGESGTISRSIGSGPVDTIHWLVPSLRLLIGTDGGESSCRSSSFDEPLTPTNFNLRQFGTQGAADVAAVKIDNKAVFVQRSGARVYELEFDLSAYDFTATDLSLFFPEAAAPGVTQVIVQRQPDTRIHFIKSDGTVACLVYDKAENVTCWLDIATDGAIEHAAVLPGVFEDRVYYHVRRVVNGQTLRYLERWAQESECKGGNVCQLADSHTVWGPGLAVTSGQVIPLPHLRGKTVVAWADGRDLGSFFVDPASGTITLPAFATAGMAGLPYEARWQSAKLALQGAQGSGLLMSKRVTGVGVLLFDTHAKGLRYGPDFDTLDELPEVEGGFVQRDQVWAAFDRPMIEFRGAWDTDSRVCLQAQAPRPVTISALVIGIKMNA